MLLGGRLQTSNANGQNQDYGREEIGVSNRWPGVVPVRTSRKPCTIRALQLGCLLQSSPIPPIRCRRLTEVPCKKEAAGLQEPSSGTFSDRGSPRSSERNYAATQ